MCLGVPGHVFLPSSVFRDIKSLRHPSIYTLGIGQGCELGLAGPESEKGTVTRHPRVSSKKTGITKRKSVILPGGGCGLCRQMFSP